MGKLISKLKSRRVWTTIIVVFLGFFLTFTSIVIYQTFTSLKEFERITENVENKEWERALLDIDNYLKNHAFSLKSNEVKKMLPYIGERVRRDRFKELINMAQLSEGEEDTLFLVLWEAGFTDIGGVRFSEGDVNEYKILNIVIRNGDALVHYRARKIQSIVYRVWGMWNSEEAYTDFNLFNDEKGFLMSVSEVEVKIDDYYKAINNQND